MANLQKLTQGQKVDLTKGKAGGFPSGLVAGLGWKENDVLGNAAKGLFGAIADLARGQKVRDVNVSTSNYDLDAFALMIDANGRVSQTVYFRNKRSSDGTVVHSGDNLTGSGSGLGKSEDKEQIVIDLNRMNPSVQKIILAVNIYGCRQRNQHFGMVKGAFIRLFDKQTSAELCSYDLTGDYNGKTAVIMGELYRYNNEWKFAAKGIGTTDGSISDVVNTVNNGGF